MIEFTNVLEEDGTLRMDLGYGIWYKIEWGKMEPKLTPVDEVIEEIKVGLAKSGYAPEPLRAAGIGKAGPALAGYWEDYTDDAVPLVHYITARLLEKAQEDASGRNRQ